MNAGRKRKGRSDRVHLIYKLTVGQDQYIGLTFVRRRSVDKTMHARICQHWYNAHVKQLKWRLSTAIRQLDCVEDVEYQILAKVRGKQAAHQYERKLIMELAPSLNTDIRKPNG